ncbi:MAG TPA: DUF2911 domain-containing protein [Gemmatimonadales bacterium]|nr:DUF2911 domain-containing protein [Gemmatimonadales bacterium]
MPRLALLPLFLALLPATLPAQGRTERAGFITTLGDDTLVVEQFTRTASRLETDLATRVPRARRLHFVATLNPDQTIARLTVTARTAVPAPDAPAFSGEMVFAADSAITTVHLGDSTQTLRVAVEPGAMPISSASYALYEQYFLRLRRSGRDSLPFQIIPIGGNQAFATYAVRRGADAMDFNYFGLLAHAKVDKAGNLLLLDGRETTNKVIVKRVPKVDVDGALRDFAARDAAGQVMGQLSPRDTVRATIGNAHLVIDYGRPHKRGREIFGGVVPWGEVWRTGANAATGFTTDADLKVGATIIPKGSYTLWSLPSENGAKLIVNSQTGQWGTDYHADKDFARVDLAAEALPQPVETFTIAIDPAAGGGVLRLEWDRTRYSLPFTVQ